MALCSTWLAEKRTREVHGTSERNEGVEGAVELVGLQIPTSTRYGTNEENPPNIGIALLSLIAFSGASYEHNFFINLDCEYSGQ
jgi:hypothetical protein